MRKIVLDNLLNTRDLGGIKTKHGYKIKNKRIIRSEVNPVSWTH